MADLALLLIVLALIAGTFFAIWNMIDNLLAYWRAHKGKGDWE